MTKKILQLSLVIVWVLLGIACTGQENKFGVSQGVLDLCLRPIAQGEIRKMNGFWEFFPKSLYRTNLSLKADHFMEVPRIWRESGWKGEGYNLYRLQIRCGDRLESPALYIRAMATAYTVRLDGKVIVGRGRPAKTPERYRPGHLPHSLKKLPPLKANNILTIEVANYGHGRGGIWEAPRIASFEALRDHRRFQSRVAVFAIGAILFMAVYHLGLFLLRRKDKMPLLFSLVCILVALRMGSSGQFLLYDLIPGISSFLHYKIVFGSAYLSALTFIAFQYRLFPEEHTVWFLRLLGVGIALCSLAVLLGSLRIMAHTPMIFSTLLLVWTLWSIVAFIRAVINKRPGSLATAVGFSIMAVFIVNDGLYTMGLINTGFWAPHGLTIFLLSQAYLISERFSRAFTQSETLAKELNESNERLRSLDLVKDEFLANTSHELRTPLQGIIGLADSLRNGAAGQISHKQDHNLELIVQSGRRLSRLVNDILDFSRLKNRDIILREKVLDMRRLTDLVLELNAVRTNGSKFNLENRIPEGFPAVAGDEDRIQQIMHNLVGNGVKFTQEGHVYVEARVLNESWAEISVKDTGIGIPEDKQKLIFESFEQADGSVARSYGGTGLGLAVSRELVELHGGEIGVESTPGMGSRFFFTLPLRPGEKQEKPTPDSQKPVRPALCQDSELISSNEGKGALVLIVDDEPINIQVARNYLSLQNYSVHAVENGQSALEYLSRSPAPDLILLDIMMPLMSGYEVCRKIRERFSPLELPVLMVTARNSTDDYLTALKAGANDYLVKPFDCEELLLRAENLLNLRKGYIQEELREEEKRAAVNNVRQEINTALHDHLGGHLTDLKFLTEELLRDTERDQKLPARIHAEVSTAILMLQEQMINIEELEHVSEDFTYGINMILLRRYAGAGREIKFTADDDISARIKNSPGEQLLTGLYSIIREICTNDLKYGHHRSIWTIKSLPEALQLDLKSPSHYKTGTHGVGRGTENLTRRTAELGGKLIMRLENGFFYIELRIPVAQEGKTH